MRRIIAILLACVFMLAISGCSGKDGGNNGGSEPAQAGLKEISVDEVPESLRHFLEVFTDWYQGDSYDSAAPDGCLLLGSIVSNGSCIDWSLYPDAQPVEHWDDGTEDPWGWCKDTTLSYKEFDKKTVDDIAAKVFNLTAGQIEKQAADGVANKIFYAEGDKYYCLIDGVGDAPTVYKLTSASYDGSKYYIGYDCCFDGAESELLASYTAVAGQKKDGGKEYWSLYSMKRTDKASGDAASANVNILSQVDNDVVTSESTGEDTYVMILRLTAVDASNNTLWEYSTPPCVAAELENAQFIGIFGDKVLVNVQSIYNEGGPGDKVEHHLYALDAGTGEIVWDNKDFIGASVGSAYDENAGMIYLCGYYGPDCFALNTEGETAWVVADIDEGMWWPKLINLQGDGIEIVFEGGEDENGGEGPFYGYVSYDGVVGNG